jgi:hypothetical protein
MRKKLGQSHYCRSHCVPAKIYKPLGFTKRHMQKSEKKTKVQELSETFRADKLVETVQHETD